MTNDTKSTPGPWRLYEGQWGDHSEDKGGGWTIMMGHNDMESAEIISAHHVSLFKGWHPEDDLVGEMYANARLIAAAPDLYEAASAALQYIVLAYRDGKESGLSEETLAIAKRDHKRLAAALAKARGDAEGGTE